MGELLPLESVGCGEWAEVADVVGEPSCVGRLAEMGVRNGSRVRMLQPGRPCLILIGGTRLSLRADWTTHILVRPVLSEPRP